MAYIKFVLVILLVLLTSVLGGCAGEEEEGENNTYGYEPQCIDYNLPTIIDGEISFGGLELGNAGNDRTAWYQVENCGWTIHEGHEGGTGDTLEITDGRVILVWAWNIFLEFTLTNRWSGQTAKGIKIGDGLDAFLDAYPEAFRDIYHPEGRIYQTSDYDYSSALFNGRGKIYEINTGYSYVSEGDPGYIQNYTNFTYEDFPGTWLQQTDTPGFAKIHKIKVPYWFDDNEENEEGDYIKFAIDITSNDFSQICLDTLLSLNEEEITRDGVCEEGHISQEVILEAEYTSTYEDWVFPILYLMVYSNPGIYGDYELSIQCPGGIIENSYGSTFCAKLNLFED